MTIAKTYRKYVKKSGLKKYGRQVYKATGLVNPIKKGNISSSRLIKDVAMLKAMINSEKKEAPSLTIKDYVGQCNGNNYAYYVNDITPIISQGVTGTTRNGVSVKLHSLCMKGQIIQQDNNHHQGRVKFEIFINKGNLVVPDISQFYNVNPVTGLYDINSPRALDTYKGYYKVATRYFNCKQDSYAGVRGWVDFTIPIKFKSHHLKYNDDNSNNIVNGQIILVILADSGNISDTVASTNVDIPVTAVKTGFSFKLLQKSWFYDN